MQIGYYAVFNYDEYDTKEEKYGISILFPDVPECNSCARSEAEGFVMAKEMLELVTAFHKADHADIRDANAPESPQKMLG
ncbi:hypothetical protein OBV_08670 [Oscillibacter valericigenes Sjm18-20]|nr:hypothetical protein OBV_08670 [Oscillibacter valericigenes Sjm18-20]